MPCPITWQPGALTPVFHGVRDLTTADSAPCAMRVFFPSIDGSETDAQILEDCGRYPLILFVHGHCDGDERHFQKWFLVPAQLARAGYVVVVPQRAAPSEHPAKENHPDVTLMMDVVSWMRAQWEHHQILSPSIGLCGHSFGALLGARLAATDFVAFASLSGVWNDWGPTPLPLKLLTIPMLFIWGDGFDPDAPLTDTQWNQLSIPRHRAVFASGFHWDYLPAGQSPCDSRRSNCSHIPGATADLVAMFFAKYMPPELLPGLPDQIPDTLIPPRLVLTPEQEFFAGGYLNTFEQLEGMPDCGVLLDKMTRDDRVVPHCTNSAVSEAITLCLQVDLQPRVDGPILNAFVTSQSPADGTVVRVGTVIRMRSQEGPTP